MIGTLLWAVVAAEAPPVVAAPPVPPAITTPNSRTLPPKAFTSGPVRADARRLAELIIPEDLYLGTIERAVIAGFEHSGSGSGDLDPKLVEALRSELVRIMREHEKSQISATFDRYARAIGSHFSTAEVSKLSEFYTSRLGQKIIVGKFAGVDVSSLMDKWADDPNADVTASDIERINRSALGKVAQHLDESDVQAMRDFMRTPTFASLAAFAPTMNALEAQIASEPDAALDAKTEAAVNEILARFGLGKDIS